MAKTPPYSSDADVTPAISRRAFIAGASLATAALPGTSAAASSAVVTGALVKGTVPKAPFDSVRDYMAAMEAHGLVRHFDAIDQDAYEGTAIMYRMVDHYGVYEAPLLVFDKVKIGGRWIKGPVIANRLRHLDARKQHQSTRTS